MQTGNAAGASSRDILQPPPSPLSSDESAPEEETESSTNLAHIASTLQAAAAMPNAAHPATSDANPPPLPPAHPPRARARSNNKRKASSISQNNCWLCVYATDNAAGTVNALICEHIHCMALDTITKQCSQVIEQEIFRRNPCNGSDVTGFTPADVKRHITDHMLHPNVKLALTLRDLLRVNEQLRVGVFAKDDESDTTIVDQCTLKNYLAVTAQISAIYKVGESGRLLFSRGPGMSAADPGPSSAGGAAAKQRA